MAKPAPLATSAQHAVSSETVGFLAELARLPAVQNGDVEAVAQFACEHCINLVETDLASVWMFNDDRTILRSVVRYDAKTKAIAPTLEIPVDKITSELAALRMSTLVASDDALSDPRFAEMRDSYLRPYGITAVLDHVIRVSGEDVGVLSFEQVGSSHPWRPEDSALARGICSYLALTTVNRQRHHADLALRDSEAKRRQSEEILARVFLQSPDAILITALSDGRILEANPGFEHITGYTRTEAIGRTTRDLDIWVDQAERDKMLAQVRRSGEVRSLNIRIRNRQNGERQCVLWGRTFDYGDVPALLTSVHDFTEMRDAAKSASDSQRMLQAVLDAVPSHVFWKDCNSVYLGSNRQFALDNGFSDPAEIVGTTDYDQLSDRTPAQLEEIRKVLEVDRQLVATKTPTAPRNALFVKPGGDVHWMSVTKTPLLDAKGDVIGILGVQHDVTELLQRQEELRASEEKLRAMFDFSPLGITLTTTDGDFLEANAAFLRIIGREHSDLASLSYQQLTPPEYAVADAREVENLATIGRYGPHEKEYLHKDGSRVPVSLNGSMVTGLDGKQYVWSTVEDITPRREVEKAQRLLKDELERLVDERTADLKAAMENLMRAEKLASLGSLVAGVAHEISTPVGNASLATSTLVGAVKTFEGQMGEKLSRSMLESFVKQIKLGVDIANRNIERVAGLIQSFKQVAVDQTSSQRRRFHLTEVVDEILTTMHPSLKRRMVGTEVSIPPDIVLDSYPGPLGQVLTNLINNSLVHAFPAEAPAPEKPRAIRVKARLADDGQLQLDVSDNGSGMAASVLGRIFDPFFTSKLGHGGSGLGLHIVHNIVADVLAGNITVASEVGTGTTFTVVMPCHTPAPAPELPA